MAHRRPDLLRTLALMVVSAGLLVELASPVSAQSPPPLVVAGPDGSLSPATPYWTDGTLAAFRSALADPAFFGAGGAVSRTFVTTALASVDAASLSGVDAFVAPAWHDPGATPAMRDALAAYFLAGGNLILMDDSGDYDPVAERLGIPTVANSDGTPCTGGAPLFDGPFGSVASVVQDGLHGRLDPADIAAHGGTVAATNASGQVTAAIWGRGDYAPGAGALVIITDVDMVRTKASFAPANANGVFALNMVAFALSLAAAPGFTVASFGPSSWGAPDATLGLPGAIVEDFEDATLVPGLSIEIDATGARTSLAHTFDPATDEAGGAFVGAAWDGQRVLLNTLDNAPGNYALDLDWRVVTFRIAGGTRSFGLSFQQLSGNLAVFVNGELLGGILDLAPNLVAGGGRNGYVRIDARPGRLIQSVRIDNEAGGSSGDGFAMDHLALEGPPLVVAGPSGSLSPATPYWTDGTMAAFRQALESPQNFGPAGVVPRTVSTVELPAVDAASLAGVDVFVAPAWNDPPASAAMRDAARAFFLAGGHLVLMDDSPDYDPVGERLGLPTGPQSDGSPSTGGAPLLDGPFGLAASVVQAGLHGTLDAATVVASGGAVAATNASGQVTAAVWRPGDYAPGAGALVIITDVDMVRTSGSFSPLNANGVFALNIMAFVMSAAPRPGFIVTGFGPSSWGASDAALGIAGYRIEDFEDTSLLPGLSVSVDADPPSATLANAFDPALDGFGNAFAGSVWDGTHVLLNTSGNVSGNYGDPLHWRVITFHFAEGTESIGFSLQQVDTDVALRVNGDVLGGILALAPQLAAGGRNGYVRIDARPGRRIYSVTIDNEASGSAGDGYAFDHLAILPPPLVVAGPDGSLSQPDTPYWTDGSMAAFRAALEDARNFGPTGPVRRTIRTVALSAVDAESLAGVDLFVAPAWRDEPATAAMRDAVRDFFLAGGDLLLLDDGPSYDPVGERLGFPSDQPSDGSPSSGGAPLFAGPFGTAGPILHAGIFARLDACEVSAAGGRVAAVNASGQVTGAFWPRGAFAPGAGALVLLTDVDMIRTTASFAPLDANGIFALNTVASFVAPVEAGGGAGFQVTGFGPESWGAPDAALGVAGLAVEEFESPSLLPGLLVEIDALGASGTLAGTFDPAADGYGTAFASGAWSQPHVLLNTLGNVSGPYGDAAHWRVITFRFPEGTRAVGFSIEHVQSNVGVRVNGTLLGGLFGVAPGLIMGDRNGYVRIDAPPGESILSVSIDNEALGNAGDGYAFDHLAFEQKDALAGVIFTASAAGTPAGVFAAKGDVHLDGGPETGQAVGLADGDYHARVTAPDGTLLGTSGAARPVHVCGGRFLARYRLQDLVRRASDPAQAGFDDTPSADGDYAAWVSTVPTFAGRQSKSAAFRVAAATPPPPPPTDHDGNGLPDVEVTVDASGLATDYLAIDGFHFGPATGPEGTRDVVRRLDVGSHVLRDARTGAQVAFTVTEAGLVSYDAVLEGVLTGAGSTSLGAPGIVLTIDASELLTDYMGVNGYYPAFGPAAGGGRTRTLTGGFLPGDYSFRDNRSGNQFAYSVVTDATGSRVEYAPALDGLLDGAGTMTLTIHGVVGTIDASELLTDYMGVLGYYPAFGPAAGGGATRKVTGGFLPGPYDFRDNRSGNRFDFAVLYDYGTAGNGRFGYDASLEGFLDGAETGTLTIHGVIGTIDASDLLTDYMGVLGYYPAFGPAAGGGVTRKVTGGFLPGPYDFRDNRSGNRFDFEVLYDPATAGNGRFGYDASLEGILDGAGTTTLTIHGAILAICAEALITDYMGIYGYYPAFGPAAGGGATRKVTGGFLPGPYAVNDNRTGNKVDFEAVDDAAGTRVEYDPALESVVAGAGTTKLTVVGVVVTIDASALAATTDYVGIEGLPGFGPAAGGGATYVQTGGLLPGSGYQFHDRRTGTGFAFDVAPGAVTPQGSTGGVTFAVLSVDPAAYCPPPNSAPAASAAGGGDVHAGTSVVLTAQVSDPDGDTLHYAWTTGTGAPLGGGDAATAAGGAPVALPALTVTTGPGGALGLGAHTITLTVEDGHGHAASATVGVTVLNLPPVARAGADRDVEAAGAQTQVQLDGPASSDPDGDPLTYVWREGEAVVASGPSPAVALGIGVHAITLTVTDPSGASASDEVVVTVRDTTAPALTLATSAACLWPPNHRMVTVEVTGRAADLVGAASAALLLRSSEADDAKGNGDGATTGDTDGKDGFAGPVTVPIALGPDGTFTASIGLRAERAGGGPGRTYTLTLTARDAAGNVSAATATVCVPHDQGK